MLSLLTQVAFLLQEPVPISETEASSSSGIDLLLPHKDELIAGLLAFVIVFFFV
jgi:hypothetical protein